MIKPEDADFHPYDPVQKRWAETIGFWFAIPEERIYGNIYVLARPNVGATISSINVVQGHNSDPFSVDFTDPHMHVPCPDSMVKFSLENGLSVEVDAPPTGYHFEYESLAGVCSMDMRLEGSMPAWDPNDPSENPLLSVDPEHSDLGLGDAWQVGISTSSVVSPAPSNCAERSTPSTRWAAWTAAGAPEPNSARPRSRTCTSPSTRTSASTS